MMPYFSCPFVPGGRNSAAMNMQPQFPQYMQPPVASPAADMQPLETQMMPMETQAPYMQMNPMGPVSPMQQMNPMGPVSPMQQINPMGPVSPMQQMNPAGMYMPQMNPVSAPMPQRSPAEYSGMDMELGEERILDPILSDPAPVSRITLFKELTGYPNYGNPSGNADILYTGTRGTWTFNLPATITGLGNLRATLVIRAVLDDHSNVQTRLYSANITINGRTVHRGPVQLPHGTPPGGRFTNWRELTFNIADLRRQNRVVIENTSRTGESDWIAFDWMEIRFTTRR